MQRMLSLLALVVMSCALTACPKGDGTTSVGYGTGKLSDMLSTEARNMRAALAEAKQPLAVIEARATSGKVHGLATWLTDQLIHHLSAAGISLVERSRLASILAEQNLSMSQLVSDDQALSIGQLVGARSLLVPHYTLLQDAVTVSLRLIDAEDGVIIITAQLSIPRSMLSDELLAELAPEASTPQVTLTLLAEEHKDGPLREHPNGEALSSYTRFKLRVAVDRPLHVYLIAIDAEGHASLLFPGALTGLSNPVTRGEYLLPKETWFVLDEHPGREAMVLLASRDPIGAIEHYVQLAQQAVAGPPTAPALKRLSDALGAKAEVIRAVHYLHR